MVHRIILLLCILISSYNPCKSQDSIVDIDGNYYRVEEIGNQVWMAENLKVTRNSSGDSLSSYFFYNDPSYMDVYGCLYSWDVMMNGEEKEGAQGICPEGWHIPSDTEWQTLVDTLGGITVAAKYLKPGEKSGFNLQFGGNFHPKLKIYSYIDRQAYYWSSSQFNANSGWMRQIGLKNVNVNRSTVDKGYSFSVRCVKD
jgi:uncharacterized protein (TIGR02145 family)